LAGENRQSRAAQGIDAGAKRILAMLDRPTTALADSGRRTGRSSTGPLTTPVPYVVHENMDGLPARVVVIAHEEVDIIVTAAESMMAVMTVIAMMATKVIGT
jgi:hypothetical protein